MFIIYIHLSIKFINIFILFFFIYNFSQSQTIQQIQTGKIGTGTGTIRYFSGLDGIDQGDCTDNIIGCKTFTYIQEQAMSYDTIIILSVNNNTNTEEEEEENENENENGEGEWSVDLWKIEKSFYINSTGKNVNLKYIQFGVYKSGIDLVFTNCWFKGIKDNKIYAYANEVNSMKFYNLRMEDSVIEHNYVISVIANKEFIVSNSEVMNMKPKTEYVIFNVRSKMISVSNCIFTNVSDVLYIQHIASIETINVLMNNNYYYDADSVFVSHVEHGDKMNFSIKVEINQCKVVHNYAKGSKIFGIEYTFSDSWDGERSLILNNSSFLFLNPIITGESKFGFMVGYIDNFLMNNVELENVFIDTHQIKNISLNNIHHKGCFNKEKGFDTHWELSHSGNIVFHNVIFEESEVFIFLMANNIYFVNFSFDGGNLMALRFSSDEKVRSASQCFLDNVRITATKLGEEYVKEDSVLNFIDIHNVNIVNLYIVNCQFLYLYFQECDDILIDKMFGKNSSSREHMFIFYDIETVKMVNIQLVSIYTSILSIAQTKSYEILNSEISNSIVHEGNLFDIIDLHTVLFSNVAFDSNKVLSDGSSLIKVNVVNRESSTTIDSCVFKNNNVNYGCVQIYRGTPLYFDYVEGLGKYPLISFDNSKFYLNRGKFGAAIYVEGCIVFDNSKNLDCYSNFADYGCCLYYKNYLDKIIDAYFLSHLVSENKLWRENVAYKAGGSIFFKNPYFDNEKDIIQNRVTSKSLGFGDIFATNPISFFLDYYIIDDIKIFGNETSIVRVSPGIHFILSLKGRDSFGSIVNVNINQIIRISTSDEIKHVQIVSFIIEQNEKGEYVSNLNFNGKPGSSFSLIIENDQTNSRSFLNVSLTDCPKSYEYNEMENKCTQCPPSYYKIIKGNDHCNDCPYGSICSHGTISSEEGFWLYKDNNTGLVSSYLCLSDECEENDECSGNRDPEFPLCEACEKGYSKLNNNCVQCKLTFWNVFWFFIGNGLFFLLFGIIVHLLANIINLTPKTKIAIFFIQNLYIVRGEEIRILFQKTVFSWIFDVLSTIIGFVFNFEFIKKLAFISCPFDISPLMSMFLSSFGKLVVFMFFIFLIFFDKFIILLIDKIRFLMGKTKKKEEPSINDDEKVSLIKKPSYEEKSKLIFFKTLCKTLIKRFLQVNSFFKSAAYIFNIVFELLVDDVAVFFSCQLFGNERRITEFTNVKCFTPIWFGWSVYYFILLAFIIMFPFLLCGFLIKNRKRLKEKEFESKYGIFYEEFKYFWFEVVQLFKRFFLVFILWITVILSSSIAISFMLFYIILLTYFVITLTLKPYKKEYENGLELISLFMLSSITLLRIYSMRDPNINILILILSLISLLFFVGNVFISKICIQKRIEKCMEFTKQSSK